jgi:hypothetical protein
MENESLNIGFALSKVTTEQFAIIEEGFSDTGNIRIGTILKFGCDEKQKLLACFGTFTFQSDEKTFMIIEAGCQFMIKDESWDKMYSKDPNRLVGPKGFLSHLAMLTVGTARGILHAKTEGTCFNKYVLPTINVTTLIREDVIFDFNMTKVETKDLI